VKLHRKDFDSLSSTSLLCLRHFTEDSYVVEGQQYRNDFGIPAQNCLKADVVPTIFTKSDDQSDTSDSRSTMTP